MSDAVALVVQELLAMPSSDNETLLFGPEPVRLQFAAKDFITRFPPGGPYSLRVETPVERSWKARIEGDQTGATHPGTALLFQGRYYEVVLSEAGGEELVYYYLSPWQEEFVIRQAAELTPQSSEQAEAEYLAAREQRKRGFLLLLASPLLGLLPGRDQVHLENKYGTNALFNTAL